MSRSTVTPSEALRRLLDASKFIDFADCKDESVWQALGAAQGTAEGVLRDRVEPEPVAYLVDWADIGEGSAQSLYYGENAAQHKNESIAQAWYGRNRKASVTPLYAAPVAAQPAVVTASVPEAVLKAATEWWLGLRPLGWSERSHLAQPAVNSSTGRGSKLALAVAAYVAAPAIAAPTEVERDALLKAAKAVLAVALDEARGRVHICDIENDDIKAKTMSEEMQALYAAIIATKE